MDTRARLSLAALLCLLPLVPLSLRLSWLQIVRHERFLQRAAAETGGQDLEIIPRGIIVDRRGRVLAQSQPVWSAFLDLPAEPEAARKAVRGAAAMLGLEPEGLLAQAKPGRRFLWLKRKLTAQESAKVRAGRLATVGLAPEEARVYPNGDLGRSLFGAVDSDGNGTAGLELTFNSKLRGRSRKIRLVRDGSGRTMPADPVSEEGEAPAELRLTLDRSAQYFAEVELREAVLRHKAKKGIVLVQEPRSGDLLAAAVYPPDPRRNAALQDVFEPGSTFKIVAAAAVLEGGIFAPTDTLDCEGGRWALTPSVTLKDHEPEGVITLAEVIERSSNIGTAKLALRVGAKNFHRHCRTFGFGYKTGLPLPGESAGLLPAHSALNPVRLANAGFGQGVAVTAIQLISAFSALANGGSLMEPRLILAVGGEPAPGPVRLRRVASEKTVAQLGSILEGVVLRGTGQSARLAGYRAAGKTGTAQKIDPATGRYSASDYLSSFIGYAPLPDPRFTILVAIDSPRVGYYGSEVAAPVFAKLARSLLALGAVPPDQPLALRVASGPNASRLVGAPASGPAPLGPSPSRKP